MKNFEKLEVGKSYKKNSGGISIIIEKIDDPVHAPYFFVDQHNELYDENGKWFMICENMDLVELKKNQEERKIVI